MLTAMSLAFVYPASTIRASPVTETRSVFVQNRPSPCPLAIAQAVHAPAQVCVPTMAARPRGNSSKRRFDPSKAPPPPRKVKLEPEETFFEGRTSWTELIIPTLSVLTVVGLIPFAAALARYIWVRYTVTSRRISVDSGFQGKDHVEIVYRDIAGVKYVRRAGGASADCVLELKDGAKLELRAIPNWDSIFKYIFERLDDDAKAVSGPATGTATKS
jgi:hypothetical protein